MNSINFNPHVPSQLGHFINSATIRYKEVLLDGNVHFISTQGVGEESRVAGHPVFFSRRYTKTGHSP